MRLRARLAKLLQGRTDVRLAGYACFAQCEHGPNAMIYPDGVWFGHLNQPDDAERLIRHATGEQPMTDVPLAVSPAERADHLANVTELLQTLEADRTRQARPRHWWWPF
jgi:(2Fe-2S) ferredoxin